MKTVNLHEVIVMHGNCFDLSDFASYICEAVALKCHLRNKTAFCYL